MKFFTQLFALTLGSILFILPVSSASADEFFGTFCWVLEVDGDDEGGNQILKLGLSHIGDLHFTLNGVISEAGAVDPSEVNLVTGNAEIVGESIVFSLHGTRNDVDNSETQRIGVNATLGFDFNGPFAAVVTEVVDGSDPAIDRVTGALTLASCPST